MSYPGLNKAKRVKACFTDHIRTTTSGGTHQAFGFLPGASSGQQGTAEARPKPAKRNLRNINCNLPLPVLELQQQRLQVAAAETGKTQFKKHKLQSSLPKGDQTDLDFHTLIVAPNLNAFELHNCDFEAPKNHRRRVSVQPVRVGGRPCKNKTWFASASPHS